MVKVGDLRRATAYAGSQSPVVIIVHDAALRERLGADRLTIQEVYSEVGEEETYIKIVVGLE